MNSQFLFFSVVSGNVPLLKEELRVFHPDLNLSFSKKGFVTFKHKSKSISLVDLQKLSVTFCLRFGLQVGKGKSENLLEKLQSICSEYKFDLATTDIHIYNADIESGESAEIPSSLEGRGVINKVLKREGFYFNIVQVGLDDYWIGISHHSTFGNPYVGGNPEISLPEESPSRAYLKMAEAHKILNLNFNKRDVFVEYGCAPGGTCLYLLNLGHKVIGVDPALMAPICLSNKNFLHLKFPLQDLSHEDFPTNEEIHWATVDLNLNPKQAIKEVLRLCKRDIRTLKGIFFTVKIVQLHHIENIESYKTIFKDFGADYVRSFQLPSHKQEFLIFANLPNLAR